MAVLKNLSNYLKITLSCLEGISEAATNQGVNCSLHNSKVLLEFVTSKMAGQYISA